MSTSIKSYYWLTKPGIIYGNAITAMAGFFLASRGIVDFGLFLAMLFGISLVIASACVINNYLDRSIDKKMSRTKNRALVVGEISNQNALIYAVVLAIIGFGLLTFYTNPLTVILALTGFFFYTVMYSIWKRRSVYGTEIGSVSGAIPIVVGYVAVKNRIDTAALLLFLILVCWQMPHFYAIAISRLKDYTAASIPVLPAKKGVHTTKIRMLLYIATFTIAALSLTLLRYTGYVYALAMLLLGLVWLGMGIRGFKNSDDKQWARKLFLFSLVVLLSFSVLISIDVWLP